jgi:hypothetical protein
MNKSAQKMTATLLFDQILRQAPSRDANEQMFLGWGPQMIGCDPRSIGFRFVFV